MENITFRFALECAHNPELWAKYFKGKTLLDVLLSIRGVGVEDLIRAGICPADAVEIMASRQNGHVAVHGRREQYSNKHHRASTVEARPEKKVTRVVIRKKDGTTIGRQKFSTGRTVAWNGYKK